MIYGEILGLAFSHQVPYATLVNSEGQSNYGIDFNGTAVCMNIDTSKTSEIERLLPEIVRAGEEKAAQYGDNRILTASKVSSIASMMEKVNQ